MTPIQKISKFLRMPNDNLEELFVKMEKATGKRGVAEKICQENEEMIARKLKGIGVEVEKADAQLVETEILKKTKEADDAFFDFFGKPNFSSRADCAKVAELAKSIKQSNVRGFFLKEEKLRGFLLLNPPKNILSALGYSTVQEMLEKEDLFEVFAALRFVENERWLNEVFFRPYNDLTADSFEEREIQVKVLSEKWAPIGEKFVGKKLHNISHLKEAGMVFLIPLEKENFAGQSLETFSLILHYLHEIDFYCKLFRKYADKPDFGQHFVDLLSGKIMLSAKKGEGVQWHIIQRYLAKLDPQDPRLFEPHVNPETVHWLKAEKEIDAFAEKNPQLKLDFWRGTDDFAGEIFPAGKKGEEIVSFDLIDNVIALTHGGLEKYLYHQQEALWNKIFIEFMGEEKLEEMIIENMERGFINL